MHGLLCRSVQVFLRQTYGDALWNAVAAEAGLPPDGFEPFRHYDDAAIFAVLAAAGHRLGKSCDQIVEDVGAHLVGVERFRRLLRFGGATYEDFLHSLDELPERVRMVVPDLELPQIELRVTGPGRFELLCAAPHQCFCILLSGVLRAMADDYGALALIEYVHGAPGEARVTIDLLDSRFARDRGFELARPEVR